MTHCQVFGCDTRTELYSMYGSRLDCTHLIHTDFLMSHDGLRSGTLMGARRAHTNVLLWMLSDPTGPCAL